MTVSTPAPTQASPLPADLGCAALIATRPTKYPDPPIPPVPDPTIAGADAQTAAAVSEALARLTALRSYRFSVDIVGREVVRLEPSSVDFALDGAVSHTNGLRVDALLGTRMREANGSGAVSGTDRLVLGDGYLWAMDNLSGVLEPSRAGQTGEFVSLMIPEGLATRVVEPFAAGYRRVGEETHHGVQTVHFRATAPGVAAYASALQFQGKVTADLWVASAGGYLAAAKVAGTGSHTDPATGATFDDGLLLAFEVTDPDGAANVIELPTAPVPDPVRPSGPPVNLQLEYQILPLNGTIPNGTDIDHIAVTTRVRLDISNRPVKVDVVKPDRIVVTICDTTHPEADRRLIEADGALTVVPLPVSEYGSKAAPGPKVLPAIGGPIDPALPPIAPAGRVGLGGQHVDPVTGRRGATFTPANEAADAFRTYAQSHPGGFVAVVLDGLVLATLPIEGQVAKARFAFTGDYTEAEAKTLVMSLYQDPLRFPLRKIQDVEAPTP